MNENATNPATDIDFQFSWEGPAEHAPGVLFEVQGQGVTVDAIATADLAEWVAVTAISEPMGNPICKAIREKVRRVVVAWRRSHGQAKLDELKENVIEVMMKNRESGTLTEEKLLQRIGVFFSEVQG